jgi:hypothetical protein
MCIDDFSRLVKVYFLKEKSAQTKCFADLAAWSKRKQETESSKFAPMASGFRRNG